MVDINTGARAVIIMNINGDEVPFPGATQVDPIETGASPVIVVDSQGNPIDWTLIGGPGGGAVTFDQLTDTPSSKTLDSDIVVNADGEIVYRPVGFIDVTAPGLTKVPMGYKVMLEPTRVDPGDTWELQPGDDFSKDGHWFLLTCHGTTDTEPVVLTGGNGRTINGQPNFTFTAAHYNQEWRVMLKDRPGAPGETDILLTKVSDTIVDLTGLLAYGNLQSNEHKQAFGRYVFTINRSDMVMSSFPEAVRIGWEKVGGNTQAFVQMEVIRAFEKDGDEVYQRFITVSEAVTGGQIAARHLSSTSAQSDTWQAIIDSGPRSWINKVDSSVHMPYSWLFTGSQARDLYYQAGVARIQQFNPTGSMPLDMPVTSERQDINLILDRVEGSVTFFARDGGIDIGGGVSVSSLRISRDDVYQTAFLDSQPDIRLRGQGPDSDHIISHQTPVYYDEADYGTFNKAEIPANIIGWVDFDVVERSFFARITFGAETSQQLASRNQWYPIGGFTEFDISSGFGVFAGESFTVSNAIPPNTLADAHLAGTVTANKVATIDVALYVNEEQIAAISNIQASPNDEWSMSTPMVRRTISPLDVVQLRARSSAPNTTLNFAGGGGIFYGTN